MAWLPLVPYGSFVLNTPTIPKFYWDVYSQEQRIKEICCEIEKLRQYADMLGINLNFDHEQILELQEQFKKFMESGFFDYYAAQIEQWVNDNMERIISQAIKMVFFGLTDDGYFCAYIPSSWDGIMFDTVMDYSSPNYGSLVLKY